MRNFFVILILLFLASPIIGAAQGGLSNDLQYDVYRVYPPISISKEKLSEIHTLSDFKSETNRLGIHYKSSWVREFISVEVIASYNGKLKKAYSKDEVLSQMQKDLMKMADAGKEIIVSVKYIPENTLKDNDAKELDFSVSIEPESEAKYYGGQGELKKYLKKEIIDEIPDDSFKQYQLAAVKFTINEDGEVIDASIFWTSENDEIDKVLLETVKTMPCWKPAEYVNGTKVKQEFVLMVGDMESCVTNLLNIYQE